MGKVEKHPYILVSACLAGCACRYDGTACTDRIVKHLVETGLALAVCPEELGGLSTPRLPSEISDQRVINQAGQDVTAEFERGARKVLQLARTLGITVAILKERSPSCGSNCVYDGSFSGKLIPGQGLTAALLRADNIKIYNQDNFPLELIDTEI